MNKTFVLKRSILKGLLHLICFLFIYNPTQAFCNGPLKIRVLSISRGSKILYESSSYSKNWGAKNLIDDRYNQGWRSEKNTPFPHIVVFELAGNAKIDLLKFNNNTQEAIYPGISSKEVMVEFSTVSPDSGYRNIGSFILKTETRSQEFSILKTAARWIRLSIKSNYGHPSYTELMEFGAWGLFDLKIFLIISNLIWIIGASIILAAISYHEFLSYMRKEKRINIFKKKSFKRSFHLGMILIVGGISASLNSPFLIAITGSVTLFLIVWFLKLSKISLFKMRKTKIEDKPG